MEPTHRKVVPADVRQRFYFVIVMPLNHNGQGPITKGLMNVNRITWEVWTQELSSVASFEYLPDAIQECERLNEEYYNSRANS